MNRVISQLAQLNTSRGKIHVINSRPTPMMSRMCSTIRFAIYVATASTASKLKLQGNDALIEFGDSAQVKLQLLSSGLQLIGGDFFFSDSDGQTVALSNVLANLSASVTSAGASSATGSVPAMNEAVDVDSLNQYLAAKRDPAAENSFVQTYYHNASIASIYSASGGVYSPTENRIYFVPAYQAVEASWLYIDCDTGSLEELSNPYVGAHSINAYNGGAYSPTENRIYFAPMANGAGSFYYFIDCGTSTIGSISHAYTIQGNGYAGAVYSPTENRIYFVPHNKPFRRIGTISTATLAPSLSIPMALQHRVTCSVLTRRP
jgi:hypothetical protein